MPVISPRRSSTSASGSLYRTTTGVGSASSSSASNLSSSSTSGSSGSSSSKPLSSYHLFLSSYSPSSYTPNTSNRNSYTPSSSYPTYLTGGTSTSGTYRSTASYYDSSLNDRYGLNKKPPIGDTLRRGDLTTPKTTSIITNTSGSSYETERLRKKPPTGENTNSNNQNHRESSNRLSGSLSSSSLARYVATSAVDMYEKYSPAHYKPNTELTRSSSRSSLIDTNDTNNASNSNNNNDSADITTHVTLERPRSRYSRLYSNESTKSDIDTVDCSSLGRRRLGSERLQNSSSANSLHLSQSNSSNDVPTATFTLRNRAYSTGRTPIKSSLDGGDSEVSHRNGIANGLDKDFKEMKVNNDVSNSGSTNTPPSPPPPPPPPVTTTTTRSSYNYNTNNNGSNNDVEVSVTLKLDENKPNDKVITKCKYKQPTQLQLQLPPKTTTTTNNQNKRVYYHCYCFSYHYH